MAAIAPHHFTIFEDSDASLLWVLPAPDDGDPAAQADVTTILRTISLDGTTQSTATLTVSSVIFDTLQTDSRWSVNSTGYNFADDIEAAKFPTGDKTYKVEYKVTWATGAITTFWGTVYTIPVDAS